MKTTVQNRIIYRGPSMIDGSPIVCIVTGLSGASSNGKTGDMLQTWILSDNGQSPIEASRSGQDSSVCGTCMHRGTAAPEKATGWANGRTCYVALNQAPTAVYSAYKRGSYATATLEETSELGRDRMVRLGSYGDPAALPPAVFRSLISSARGHTGYTHGRGTDIDYENLMVSADNKKQAQGYHLNNKRTFRVIPVSIWADKGKASMLKNEVLCPASKEAGQRTTCESCKLCSGSGIKAKSIAIVAHGTSRNGVK
tara:strand:- start:103 stop:867 length:765 start_codon:yes stop_codon:yes gene_type:complete